MNRYRAFLLTANGQLVALLGMTEIGQYGEPEKIALLETLDLLLDTIGEARELLR